MKINRHSLTGTSLTYWHVWTDDEGISHQTLCELTNFTKKSTAEGTAPQWNDQFKEEVQSNSGGDALKCGVVVDCSIQV